MTFSSDSQIVELWLQARANPHTRDCYRRDAARLLAHTGKPLIHTTLPDLQSFAESLNDSGLAPISCVRTLAAIKSLFGFCHRMHRIAVNPAAELTLQAYERHLAERILTEDDVQRMLSTTSGESPRDHVLLHLLYAAGLRVSEACRLRWRNLQARGWAGQITVFGKNGRTRAVTLPPAVWSELIRLRGVASPEAPIFPSRTGKCLDRGRVRVIVRRAAQRAGVAAAVSPHWLRHAHASHALDHGAPIHLVQATLGHSSVATTGSYLHARPEDSSTRFLETQRESAESGRIRLPWAPAGVMNVSTARNPPAAKEIRMSVFTIDTENNVTAYANPEGASQGGEGLTRFDSQTELGKVSADWPMSRFVEIYNGIPGQTEISKFADRKRAVAKVWKAIQQLTAGLKDGEPQPATEELSGGKRKGGRKEAKAAKPGKRPGAKKAARPVAAERSNKRAEVIAMMKRPKGATLVEIMEATGWQKHTVRGFVSILGKKGGEKVESLKNSVGERTYKIGK